MDLQNSLFCLLTCNNDHKSLYMPILSSSSSIGCGAGDHKVSPCTTIISKCGNLLFLHCSFIIPKQSLYIIKVGVNPSQKKEMWFLMHLITKKTCTKMYKSIHFWNQKSQMNPMVATDFCKIMRFSRNSSVTMVTIEFFLDSITKIWVY